MFEYLRVLWWLTDSWVVETTAVWWRVGGVLLIVVFNRLSVSVVAHSLLNQVWRIGSVWSHQVWVLVLEIYLLELLLWFRIVHFLIVLSKLLRSITLAVYLDNWPFVLLKDILRGARGSQPRQYELPLRSLLRVLPITSLRVYCCVLNSTALRLERNYPMLVASEIWIGYSWVIVIVHTLLVCVLLLLYNHLRPALLLIPNFGWAMIVPWVLQCTVFSYFVWVLRNVTLRVYVGVHSQSIHLLADSLEVIGV